MSIDNSATKTITTEIGSYRILAEPYYLQQGNEVEMLEAAWRNQIPVLLKGPTGCGKTRFMEYMAWRLEQALVTISCHDDLTASDLIGRFLIVGGETRWIDGPLTTAVRLGAICYLDEIVEARKDTTVVIHPLADDRRILPIEKTGEVLNATSSFCLSVSYNPGYQSVLKDLKQSTRQRFIAIEFDYPNAETEIKIITEESGLDSETAGLLVRYADMTRNLKGNGLEEGASTRLLVHAAKLMQSGIEAQPAYQAAIAESLTDEPDMIAALKELGSSLF